MQLADSEHDVTAAQVHSLGRNTGEDSYNNLLCSK